jgi:hypothetical protein
MQTLANFKRGDIFQLGGIAKDSGGITIDLTAVTLRSQVRTVGGALVAELLVNKADQVTNKGEFSLSFATTTDWPTGYLLIDIEQRVGAGVTSSETVRVPVLEDITHD